MCLRHLFLSLFDPRIGRVVGVSPIQRSCTLAFPSRSGVFSLLRSCRPFTSLTRTNTPLPALGWPFFCSPLILTFFRYRPPSSCELTHEFASRIALLVFYREPTTLYRFLRRVCIRPVVIRGFQTLAFMAPADASLRPFFCRPVDCQGELIQSLLIFFCR